jgi:hypothetical protein
VRAVLDHAIADAVVVAASHRDDGDHSNAHESTPVRTRAHPRGVDEGAQSGFNRR